MRTLYFGKLPVILGGEGDYVLVEAAAATLAESAHECRTWGEYARLVKCDWKDLVDGWGDAMACANDGSLPSCSTRFSYGDIVGKAADLVIDPREAAYDAAWRLVATLCKNNVALSHEVDVSHGSPMGHIQCISSSSLLGFQTLAALIATMPKRRIQLVHDDSRVARCLVGSDQADE